MHNSRLPIEYPQVFSRRDFLKLCGVVALGTYGLTRCPLQSFGTIKPIPTIVIQHGWLAPIHAIAFPKAADITTGLPGSIMKLLATAILLENKLINPNTRFECRGITNPKLTNSLPFHCSHPHGQLTLVDALAVSCNAYFAHVITHITVEQFVQMWSVFFQNKPLSLLPTQALLPSYLLGYHPAVTLSASDLLHGVQRLALQDLVLHPYTLHVLRQGMRQAARIGTGKKADPSDRYQLVLKTGTSRHGNTYQSWVAGYFPFESPKAVFCCRGVQGTSEESAIPTLRTLLSYYQSL